MIEAGVPVRNVERGTMVSMFVSNLACAPAGRFHGPMVVTMRPIPAAQVALVRALSARYPHAHGAPIHYCTISPAWQYASPDKVVQAITRVGASRCLLVSDTGQRHNPLPSEARRIFAQTLFERGIAAEDIHTMIMRNPNDLLDVDTAPELPDDVTATWAAALADPCGHTPGHAELGMPRSPAHTPITVSPAGALPTSKR